MIETPFGYHIIRVDRVQAAEVKARHILIAPMIDSADVAAREGRSGHAWPRSGVAAYRTIRWSRSITTRPKRREFCSRSPRDSLPASYRRRSLAPRRATSPRRSSWRIRAAQPKYAVLQVVTLTDAGEYNEAEVRDQIRAQLVRRAIDQAAARRAAKADLRVAQDVAR